MPPCFTVRILCKDAVRIFRVNLKGLLVNLHKRIVSVIICLCKELFVYLGVWWFIEVCRDGGINCPPEAEVIGSNPIGRTNNFIRLAVICWPFFWSTPKKGDSSFSRHES
jgi:hypothetical protein